MWWNDGMGWFGAGWGGWGVMTLVMLAFWALVVFGVVALFRNGDSAGSSGGSADERNAQKILDERFARGEIDAQEYQARQAVLRSAQHHL